MTNCGRNCEDTNFSKALKTAEKRNIPTRQSTNPKLKDETIKRAAK